MKDYLKSARETLEQAESKEEIFDLANELYADVKQIDVVMSAIGAGDAMAAVEHSLDNFKFELKKIHDECIHTIEEIEAEELYAARGF